MRSALWTLCSFISIVRPSLLRGRFLVSLSTPAQSLSSLSVMSKRKSTIDAVNETIKIPKVENRLPFVHKDFKEARARVLTKLHGSSLEGRSVVLWMSRDQRVRDNHAFHYAQLAAISLRVPLKVAFAHALCPADATLRRCAFMLKGLQEVEADLRKLEIPFYFLMGDPVLSMPSFLEDHQAALVVGDFNPLREPAEWAAGVASELDQSSRPHRVPFVQVDAHNIVPCWIASPKLEYSARTFRSKITSKIPEFLTDVPAPEPNPAGSLEGTTPVDWTAVLDAIVVDRQVGEVDWIRPGPAAADAALAQFLQHRLRLYADKRNDPTQDAQSNLSPYAHFGQLSMQKAVLLLKRAMKGGQGADAFVEEAVVRRELTDNYCFYCPLYDQLGGAWTWAQETLVSHSRDPRPVAYTREKMESASTHDDLWNAAQLQMVQEGKMHGFLRMYWAKKVLEWSPSPQEALATALALNDKYELDGCDPNGFVGCMWSIAGVHDQGWGERAIFGKIRFMNYEGCRRKFDVKAFVNKYPPAARNAAAAQGQRTLTR